MTADLRAAYAACRELNRRHGRTYYLATLLLPAWKRPYVHALYGFARYADEIVDDVRQPDRGARLDAFAEHALADLRRGDSDHLVTAALVDTVARWDIPLDHVEAFLAAMRMDLTVTDYATYDDLLAYMHGSAAVIGLQMLPVLEPQSDDAAPYARDLGLAFQLTNFIRDVGEDLRRGRLYLPLADLQAHGVTRADLERGATTDAVRALLAYEISHARVLYAQAEPGVELLHPTSRDCIRTAARLYGGILDAVERADYRVLDRRVAVGLPTRARVAAAGLVRARWSLRPTGDGRTS